MIAASLDIDDLGRVERTLVILDIKTLNQLSKLHEFEIKQENFLYANFQIRALLKIPSKKRKITNELVELVAGFNDENKPLSNEDSYTGMEYHHAWDKSVWFNRSQINLEPFESKNSGSSKLISEILNKTKGNVVDE